MNSLRLAGGLTASLLVASCGVWPDGDNSITLDEKVPALCEAAGDVAINAARKFNDQAPEATSTAEARKQTLQNFLCARANEKAHEIIDAYTANNFDTSTHRTEEISYDGTTISVGYSAQFGGLTLATLGRNPESGEVNPNDVHAVSYTQVFEDDTDPSGYKHLSLSLTRDPEGLWSYSKNSDLDYEAERSSVFISYVDASSMTPEALSDELSIIYYDTQAL